MRKQYPSRDRKGAVNQGTGNSHGPAPGAQPGRGEQGTEPRPNQSRDLLDKLRASRKQAVSRQRGFTLLEALVATAVLGASVAALLGLFSGALRNAARIEAPERALLLGQSKLNELLSAGATTENGTAELPFDQTIEGRWDERFRWEARAARFRSSPERRPGEILLSRITLDVIWKTGTTGAERKLSFETYQLRREPAGAGP